MHISFHLLLQKVAQKRHEGSFYGLKLRYKRQKMSLPLQSLYL